MLAHIVEGIGRTANDIVRRLYLMFATGILKGSAYHFDGLSVVG
jgi:hypothetical protein